MISDTGRYRWLVLTAPVLTLVTNLGFTTFDVDSSIYDAIPWLVVAGFAMGIIYPTMTTATQNSLTLVDLGAGTAAINFFRSLGSTIGVGALGALLTSTINHELGRLDATERGALDVDELLSTPQDIQALEPTLRMAVENAVAVATNLIMWSAVPVITLFCVIAWFLPELELRTTTALADAEAEQSGGAATPG